MIPSLPSTPTRLLVATLMLAVCAASASAITYNLTSAATFEYYDPGLTLVESGLAVTVSGLPRFLHQDSNGVGVSGGPFLPGDDPEADNDPNGYPEAITLLFSERVRLESVAFTQVGLDDWAMVKVDTATIWQSMLFNGNVNDTGVWTLDLTGLSPEQRAGTSMSFSPPFWSGPSDFKISSITVTRAPLAPLPTASSAAAATLLILAAMRALRRPVLPPQER